MTKGKSVEEIPVDDSAMLSKVISEDNCRLLRDISSDEIRDAGTSGTATAPEMHCAGLIAAVLRALLPGPGMTYLS